MAGMPVAVGIAANTAWPAAAPAAEVPGIGAEDERQAAESPQADAQ